MKRRELLKAALALPLLPMAVSANAWGLSSRTAVGKVTAWSRVRPGQAGWPSAAQWAELGERLGGRLLQPVSPFTKCGGSPSAECTEALRQIKNPYYIGDHPALTQTSGWVDAWTSQPSAWAVAAESTSDVVAAVNFARAHRLRLVVKGGGHSYQGTSAAPDSLLIWTRRMNRIELHDAFVGQGCGGRQEPQPAVSIGAGAMWVDAYDAVTTQAGRYVQGGGCMTVGVAGLVQSGGFGSFSKQYGTASAGLIEAEMVTADGKVLIANACTNPDLFWGIKGGGGGSLGVVTRLTLRTRALPDTFGAVFGAIRAASAEAYRALISRAVSFYAEALCNPHWGEQMVFRGDNVLRIAMVFQGLSKADAEAVWKPFLDWVASNRDYSYAERPQVLALPARHFWDAEFLRKHAPDVIVPDARDGAPRNHVIWSGDEGQVGQVLQGYRSGWLPSSLLRQGEQSRLVDALFACTRHFGVGLHFNKGLAGAPAAEVAAARDTATHPSMLDAFALAITGSETDPYFPGMPGPGPDVAQARDRARRIDACMDTLLKVAPGAGSYVSESNYFEPDWQRSFWGSNYPRLLAVKKRYDPDGLFFVRHGVGSEGWSEDGFSRA
ncbi:MULTISPECIES: FAD-binding protein [Dyella]|uniref:FAD-binding oxidoreductase n=2 Tax=Dyella TaxID=231454 RepID=A0A4R0YZH8_9GAMM|nr:MULTISPECIES: FAD-binding oxidoreductase [Dyella]TBR40192.1 FAD-binding oxidoreductase [Dyella terrae]TCI12226.1 FAD-binding oxidoreductase [Dyella soli]